MMIGEIEEVYQALHRNGYIEFDYKDGEYMMEAGREADGKRYLEIWTAYWEKENVCIFKEEISEEQLISKEAVDKVLNARCFDGKSFLEIANDVELTTIFGSD